jgi:transposase
MEPLPCRLFGPNRVCPPGIKLVELVKEITTFVFAIRMIPLRKLTPYISPTECVAISVQIAPDFVCFRPLTQEGRPLCQKKIQKNPFGDVRWGSKMSTYYVGANNLG